MSRWTGLEEIVAVADGGSFVAGARTLGVSTSHISRAVAQLEQRLDARLFNRSTCRVVLTETGRHLVDHARRIIEERDEALALIDGGGEPQGTLLLTCSIGLGERFVAPIARAIAREYPGLNMRIDLTNRVVDLIGEGYDLGIRSGSITDARLVSRRLGGRRFITCASPDYLSRKGQPTSVEDLGAHDCLIGTNTTWRFLLEGAEHQLTPAARWQCNSGTALAEAACEGLGICQIPAFYVSESITVGRLVAILGDIAPEDEPVWLIYPHRRRFLPKVRVVAEALQARFPEAFR